MASQKVHGITIELDANTSGVNEAFKDLNKSVKSTQKELKEVDKLLKSDPSNLIALTQKQDLLTDAIDKTQNKLIQLSEAKRKAEETGEIDKNSKEYRELERDIEATKIQLQKFTDELKQNDNVIEQVNDGTYKYAENLEEAGNKAVKFGDILKANVIADFIVSGIKALANAFVDLGKGIYNSVRESGKFADDVNTLAKQYNLSTKEIQAYSRASELIDIDINTIAKSMSKLTKNMTSTSSSVVGAFEKLGIVTKDSSGELRDSNEVFNEVIEKLGQISNETEQDSIALEIFGKSASDLGTLINGGAEELNKFNKYLEENNLLLSQDELDTLNAMNDSFDMLSATIDAAKDKIGVELAPAIQPVVDKLVEVVNESGIIQKLTDLIATFLEEHQQEIIDTIDKVLEWVTSQEAQDMFNDISDLLLDLFDIGIQITDLIKNVGILKIAFDGVKAVVEVIKGILTGINAIITGEAWRNGTLFSGGWNDVSELQSGGYGTINSGGFGGVTLNANFSINNANDINESVVKNWASLMVEQINEELGRMV